MIRPEEAACPNAPTLSTPASSRKRILVIDDDPGLLCLYQTLLGTRGYQILTAEDGAEALIVFERERPTIDLLIADLCLPKLSGVEMLLQMKAGGRLPPVLVCSGSVEFDAAQTLGDMGTVWFLPKPFRNREILREIARLLDGAPAGRS